MNNVKKEENEFEELKNNKIFSPAVDWVFKLLFGDERNKSMLIDLLGSFLELPKEEYELEFLDTHLKKEAVYEKWGIIDVKIRTKTGKVIDIEIQVNPFEELGKRLSFYKSKMVVAQIGEGADYSVIQKVICVCITNYTVFPWRDGYLNKFIFCNPETGLTFDEIPEEVYTLEIPKVPKQSDGKGIWDWLQFLRSKTKEEFDMVAETNEEIRKAVKQLYILSQDQKNRDEYEWRLKCLRDYNTGMNSAFRSGKAEGKAEVAKKMKARGRSIEEIAEDTGLSVDEIETL
jgi:predicted transposase/invertase (TIGR01784 family)